MQPKEWFTRKFNHHTVKHAHLLLTCPCRTVFILYREWRYIRCRTVRSGSNRSDRAYRSPTPATGDADHRNHHLRLVAVVRQLLYRSDQSQHRVRQSALRVLGAAVTSNRVRPIRSNPPRSTCAIEPPPAPMVVISTIGVRIVSPNSNVVSGD